MARAATAHLRAPEVDGDHVRFVLRDPRGELRAVRLSDDLARPRVGRDLVRVEGSTFWELLLPRPDADRIEYTFELTRADGSVQHVCDPANPRRVPGPFGDRSVIELPEYERPGWLHAPPITKGRVESVELPSAALRTTVAAQVWTAPGSRPSRELPLLVVHDGPEYARFSGLLSFLDRMFADGRLPPLRAALLPPPNDRNETYSASALYARALTRELLPGLREAAPAPAGGRHRIGMGASLGALAMLHAYHTHPDELGGLFLQSGSFFRRRYDRHESGFARFGRISRFVGRVLAAPRAQDPIPIVITCGSAEENIHNNRAVAAVLEQQGHDVRLHVQRDAHNWVAWRDSFDPHLTDLVARAWA